MTNTDSILYMEITNELYKHTSIQTHKFNEVVIPDNNDEYRLNPIWG